MQNMSTTVFIMVKTLIFSNTHFPKIELFFKQNCIGGKMEKMESQDNVGELS